LHAASTAETCNPNVALKPTTHGAGAPELEELELVEVDQFQGDEMQDIVVTERMFLDHFPSVLEHRIGTLCQISGLKTLPEIMHHRSGLNPKTARDTCGDTD